MNEFGVDDSVSLDMLRYQNHQKRLEEEQAFETCVACIKRFTPLDEQNGNKIMLMETECFHMIHKNCFKIVAFNAKSKGAIVKCPMQQCNKSVPEYEVKMHLSPEEQKEMEELEQNYLISQNSAYVRCSCGNVMEVVEGQLDLNQKDDMGKPITREAAVCMSKYRVRCNECQKNFCCNPQCQSEPYHTGKTCT